MFISSYTCSGRSLEITTWPLWYEVIWSQDKVGETRIKVIKCKDLERTMLIDVAQIKEFPERVEYHF